MTDSRVDDAIKQWLTKDDMNYFNDLGELGCVIDGDGYQISELKASLLKLLLESLPTKYSCKTSLDKQEETVKWYHDGYNSALNDVKNKIEELFSR